VEKDSSAMIKHQDGVEITVRAQETKEDAKAEMRGWSCIAMMM